MKNSKNLPERIKILLSYLNQNLSGKEKVIGLTLLSVIAGENILFLGSSKSEKRTISRRVASAFRDFYKDGKFNFRNARYFECFMTKSSSLDDICGPVNRATMRHLTESYLPGADIAFLDEIWNIHPNVQNTVLKIINDRIYHNGNMVQDVPLLSVIAASKEISFPPAMVFHRFKNNYGTEKNEVLEALRDTFTVRVFVDPISNNDDFFSFLDLADDELIMIPNAEQKAALLSIDEIRLWQQEINKVELSETSKYFISAIRKTLSDFNTENTYQGGETYNISDFRWKKIVRLLKTSAFLNGRNTTDLSDLSIIECCIWNTNKQHDETADILAKLYSAPIDDINEQVQAFKERADEKWFKFIEEEPAKDVIVKIDGRPYYECTSNQGQTVYVEKRGE